MNKGHLILIVLLVLSGLFWLREHDKATKDNALAQAREQELAQMIAVVKGHDSVDAKKDTVYKQLMRQVKSLNTKLENQAKTITVKIDSSSRAFEVTLTDSQKVEYENVKEHYRDLIENQQVQIRNTQALLAEANAVIDSKNKLLSEYRTTNDSLFKQVQVLSKEKKMSTGKAITTLLPIAALTYLVFK